MLIGELVQKSGFSRDTIRYYEKLQLLTLPKKARRENNYKEYTYTILSRLQAIKQLKNIGYTLQEIQQLLLSYEQGNIDCEIGKEKILEKVTLIDKQIEDLLTVKKQLLEAIVDCPDNCKIINILDTTLNAPYTYNA